MTLICLYANFWCPSWEIEYTLPLKTCNEASHSYHIFVTKKVILIWYSQWCQKPTTDTPYLTSDGEIRGLIIPHSFVCISPFSLQYCARCCHKKVHLYRMNKPTAHAPMLASIDLYLLPFLTEGLFVSLTSIRLSQIARFMGPIWGRQDPGGPHVGPMKFAIWGVSVDLSISIWMGLCKKDITPVHSQWSYVFLAPLPFDMICKKILGMHLVTESSWKDSTCIDLASTTSLIYLNMICIKPLVIIL